MSDATTPPQDEPDWDAWVEGRRDIFERQATFNATCGQRLEAAGRGWARMRMPLRPELMNPFGAAHGGAVCALIDSVAGTTIAASIYPRDDIAGTIDMQVHFLERATGGELVGEGRLVRAGNAVAIAQVDVRNDAGALVAIGTATFRLGRKGAPRRNED